MAAHQRKKSSLVFLRKIKTIEEIDGEAGSEFYDRQVNDITIMHV
jgi:hypothetical protein